MDGFEYLVKLKTLKIQGNKIDKSKNVNKYILIIYLVWEI